MELIMPALAVYQIPVKEKSLFNLHRKSRRQIDTRLIESRPIFKLIHIQNDQSKNSVEINRRQQQISFHNLKFWNLKLGSWKDVFFLKPKKKVYTRHSPDIHKSRHYLRGELKGAGGGPDMIDHQNKFYAVFWKRGVRPTSCFLPDQKILILAKVIAGQRSAPMCNSIVHAIFIRVYLKN